MKFCHKRGGGVEFGCGDFYFWEVNGDLAKCILCKVIQYRNSWLSTRILLVAHFPELKYCMEEYASQGIRPSVLNWRCSESLVVIETYILIYRHKIQLISCFALEKMKTGKLAYIPSTLGAQGTELKI